jgi:hypothetical protein
LNCAVQGFCFFPSWKGFWFWSFMLQWIVDKLALP